MLCYSYCFRRRHFLNQTLIDPRPRQLIHCTGQRCSGELIETNGRAQSEPIHPALARAGGGTTTTDGKKTKRIGLTPRNKWKTRRNCGNVLFIVRRRVTAAARSTLTDGAESITRTLSKELRGNIISPVSKASWKQLNNSIVDS